MAMKAVRAHFISEPGDRSNISLDDVPRPVPRYNELLVRVVAAGANPAEYKFSTSHADAGKYVTDGTLPPLPRILGMDFSGIVEACGAALFDWKPGDAVFGKTDVSMLGSWAEYLVIPANEVARKPEGLSHEGAASLTLAGKTAWSAMYFSNGVNIQPGETLLVHGGAGGVGSLAVQMAKHCGARVIATASAHNCDFVRELGADEVIDYRDQRFEDIVGKVDAVLDTVGGEIMERSYGVVKLGGRMITVVHIPSPETAAAHGIRAEKITGWGGTAQHLADLFVAGSIKPVVSGVYALSEATQVLDQLEQRHVRGKLVLRP